MEVFCTIRQASLADLSDICAIYNHYVLNTVVTFDEEASTPQQWRATFSAQEKNNMPFLVAELADGKIIGFAYVVPWRQKTAYRHTVENSVYVAPDATSRGVGTALLTELVTHSRRVGITEMLAVIADQETEASLRLHEKCGFVRVGSLCRVGFKFNRWIGTVLLQKSLNE